MTDWGRIPADLHRLKVLADGQLAVSSGPMSRPDGLSLGELVVGVVMAIAVAGFVATCLGVYR